MIICIINDRYVVDITGSHCPGKSGNFVDDQGKMMCIRAA